MKPKKCPLCDQHFIGDAIVCVRCSQGNLELEKVMSSSTDLDKEILISALRNEVIIKAVTIQRLMNRLVEKEDVINELGERIEEFLKDIS